MKLINSFHGATCICKLLRTKLSNKKQRSAKPLLNDEQTNPRVLGHPSKNVGSNLEAKFPSSSRTILASFIEPEGNSAATRPRAWCPRYRRPDDEASDGVKGELVDRAVSIETSLKQSIRHQQSCQQTENAPAAVEARWRANPHHQECLANAWNRGEDVAFINYDSLNGNRQN